MRTISATLGLDNPVSAKTLAIDLPSIDLGKPLAIKEESRIPRVDRAELEAAYLLDGVTFNTINTAVELIMVAGHMIVAEDKDTLRFFENFTNNIGSIGNTLTWEELVTKILLYQCLYGDMLVERIRGEAQKGETGKIIDLDAIDPKRHDYAKDKTSKVALDNYGRPIGYTQQYSQYTAIQRAPSGIKLPKGINITKTEVFFPKDNISHFKMFVVGDGLIGIGYVEPVYKTILRKLNIQHAQGNAAYRHSTPLFYAKVGDENHEPTPQVIENILQKVKKARNNYDISFPYFVNLEILEAQNSEAINGHLGYLGKEEISSSGTPAPYATGGGEATNRATLRDQTSLYEIKLQWLAEKLAKQIEHLIFKPIAHEQGLAEVPQIRWGPVGIGKKERSAESLIKFVDSGILGVDEVRKRIKELGILDIDPNKIPQAPESSTRQVGGQEKPATTKEDRIRSEKEE